MEHTNKHGESKVKKQCTLPLTGKRVVHRLITELAVFDFTPSGTELVEFQPGVSLAEVAAKTEAAFVVSKKLSTVWG